MESAIKSQTLSGWPSETDSDVKVKRVDTLLILGIHLKFRIAVTAFRASRTFVALNGKATDRISDSGKPARWRLSSFRKPVASAHRGASSTSSPWHRLLLGCRILADRSCCGRES